MLRRSILLVFAFLLSATIFCSCASIKTVTWTLDIIGTLTVSSRGDMTNWESALNVPWYSNRFFIKKVVIEDGVTGIGECAFSGCRNLISVDIPDGVTSIGKYAFSDCCSLTSIKIPDSVTKIGDDAFYGCNILVIYGCSGSYAQEYASENKIPFIPLA